MKPSKLRLQPPHGSYIFWRLATFQRSRFLKIGYVRSALHTPTVLMTMQRRLLAHGNLDFPAMGISSRSSVLLCRPWQEDIEYKFQNSSGSEPLVANNGLRAMFDMQVRCSLVAACVFLHDCMSPFAFSCVCACTSVCVLTKMHRTGSAGQPRSVPQARRRRPLQGQGRRVAQAHV